MKRLVYLIAVVLVAIGTPESVLAGEIRHLTAEDRAHLLGDHFRVVAKVAELPAGVIAAFAEHTKESPFRMADPGEEWQVTDVVIKENLAGRRLVFAGISEGYCVMHYENGGIGHNWWVVLFQLSSSGPAREVWAASTDKWGAYASLPELRRAVRKEKLRDDPRYFW